jgi:hypothetical protein
MVSTAHKQSSNVRHNDKLNSAKYNMVLHTQVETAVIMSTIAISSKTPRTLLQLL